MLYRFHDCELDDSLYQLRRAGKPTDIEPKVFDVLAYLLHSRDHAVTKDELLEKLWPGQVVSETALTRCIVAARKAVGDDGTRQEVIETQHGRGYRFVAPVTERVVERKLAAILHTDVKGHSRLIGEDEVTTLRTVASHLGMMRTLVGQHGGRAIGSRGDSLLAEFPSVVEAVQGAVEIQQELKVKNATLSIDRRVEFRIGINLGEVVVEGVEIYDEGVNIAVRLESIAEPGGICISEVVYDQIKNRLALKYETLGEQLLKNIAQPVRVYRIKLEPEPAPSAVEAAQSTRPAEDHRQEVTSSLPQPRVWPRRTLVLGGVLLLVGMIGAVQYLSLRPPAPAANIPPDQSQPLPLPDKPSIVVLPFANLSEDPKQEYFSDGITEDLTSDLSRISNLFVIARNSAFTYKGKVVKVQDVSKELGVRYVLEGSVRKADDQVRISAQLIDATTGAHQWAERYDRPLKDIFALQDEIVQKIVANLQVEVLEAEFARVRRIPTDNLTAYDSLLRGMEAANRFTKEAHAQARQMFEKALALDPQYAEAYVWLGGTYYMEWIWRWSMDPQTLERALALMQQALALDDSLPDAHASLGQIYAVKQQYDQAITQGERAIVLDPNNAESYAQQAEVLSFAGRPEEALRSVEQAMRLNPRYPAWYLIQAGWAYNSTGRYEEAITALKALLLQNPNFLSAYLHLAISYLAQWAFQLSQDLQTLEQALAAAQRVVALNDSLPWAHIALGYVYLGQKQYDQAITEMERAIALDPNSATSYAGLAEMLGWMGRPEEALQMVEQALRRKPAIVDEHLGSIGGTYYLAGKPEEAIAPLKQYINRYPNILGAHLGLAAAYSELGKETEARAEAAEVLRINPNYSLEVARQRSVWKDPARLEQSLAALRKAGLK